MKTKLKLLLGKLLKKLRSLELHLLVKLSNLIDKRIKKLS